MPRPQSQISPVGTQVLVKVAEAETKTAGGILLAESSQRKPTSGAYPPKRKSRPPALNPVATDKTDLKSSFSTHFSTNDGADLRPKSNHPVR